MLPHSVGGTYHLPRPPSGAPCSSEPHRSRRGRSASRLAYASRPAPRSPGAVQLRLEPSSSGQAGRKPRAARAPAPPFASRGLHVPLSDNPGIIGTGPGRLHPCRFAVTITEGYGNWPPRPSASPSVGRLVPRTAPCKLACTGRLPPPPPGAPPPPPDRSSAPLGALARARALRPEPQGCSRDRALHRC